MNGQRVREGHPPFADIESYLEDLLVIRLRESIKEQDILEGNSVREAYTQASDPVQAQVRTILGV